MRQAAVIGIGPEQFWQMTPRWVLSLVDGHEAAKMAAMRFEVTIAWLTAAWPRMKRMPELRRVLNQLGLISAAAPRQQTPEEMLAAGRQWAAYVGAVQKQAPTKRVARGARLASLERWRAQQSKAEH